ncbi:MAG: fluoride efflux transporter CrcB [Leptolyngbyaceae cyanobacterium RU_5_1]|nr:fluoride efflux transporter CrcB [Leptolyngbyaceae cyanobacterium RU_5_1]
MLNRFFYHLLGSALGFSNVIHSEIRSAIAISLGAIPGALSRYYLTVVLSQWLGTRFPYGTFVINITGALILGFFVTFTLERAIAAPELRLLVAVGFLGSYTTFSTYALDTSNLLQSGNKSAALIYWLGSATLGFISLQIGSLLAKRIA